MPSGDVDGGVDDEVDTEEHFQVLEEQISILRWRVRVVCVATLMQGVVG